jgi:hypothetical protein
VPGMPPEMYAQGGVDIRLRRLLAHPLRLRVETGEVQGTTIQHGPADQLTEVAAGPKMFAAAHSPQPPPHLMSTGACACHCADASGQDVLAHCVSCSLEGGAPYGCCALHGLSPCGSLTPPQSSPALPVHIEVAVSPPQSQDCMKEIVAMDTSRTLILQDDSNLRIEDFQGAFQKFPYLHLVSPDLTKASILIHISSWLSEKSSDASTDHRDCYGCHLLHLSLSYILSLKSQLNQLISDSACSGYLCYQN